jgi:ribosomal protein S6
MAEVSHPEALAEGFTQASADEADRAPVYEVGFHIVPTVPEAGVGGVVEKIRKALGSAEIINEGYPQKMHLAYPIERAEAGKREHYSESWFGWIKFAPAGREAAPALGAALKDMKDILRSLIIETVREDIAQAPRRAVFTSDRLEGEVIKKPLSELEKAAEVSEAELDKSIEQLVGE